MNIYSKYLNEIKNIIFTIAEELSWDLKNSKIIKKIVLEPPKNQSFGDLSTNAAMVLASQLKFNSIEIGEILCSELKIINDFDEVEFVKPGFINIKLNTKIWHTFLFNLVTSNNGWIYENLGQGKFLNVEFVSANPTGPLHAGHARGAVFGDTLASILSLVGYKVLREYYVNDAGNQIEALVESCFLRYLENINKREYSFSNGLYPGNYLKKVGKKINDLYGKRLIDLSFDKYFPLIKPIVIEMMLNDIKNDLVKLGVEMDVFTSETKILESNRLDKILKILNKKKLLYTGILEKPKGNSNNDWEPRPQLLFNSKKFGDDTDRALKKADNSWTYFASDIAYHLDKIERTSGNLINILGADHGGYISRISSAVNAITDNKCQLINKICSIVHLSDNGQIIKMSKRSGDFVTLSEILNKVGKDVIRFMMLTRRNDQTIEFDFHKVKEQSKDNPIFYVNYAYARCKSILNSSNFKNNKIDLDKISKLTEKKEIDLIKLLSQWPRVLEASAKYLEPHRVCFYLIDLASQFHSLWNKGNEDKNLRFILKEDKKISTARIALVNSVAITIESGLNVLSIKPTNKM